MEEEYFPRGKIRRKGLASWNQSAGKKRKQVVRDEDVDSKKTDVLFESLDDDPVLKGESNLKKESNVELPRIGYQKRFHETIRKRLTLKRCREGSLILGCVAEVCELKVLVSLPHGIMAQIQITDISNIYNTLLQKKISQPDEENLDIPTLDKLLPVGTKVCSVVKTVNVSGRLQRICLSLEPSLINKTIAASDVEERMIISAAVQSVEEHGCLMDVGIRGLMAFLTSKQSYKFESEGKLITPGQVLLCAVKTITNKGTMLKLEYPKQSTKDPVYGKQCNTLLPGTIVNTLLHEVSNDGLLVSFKTNLQLASIHVSHIHNNSTDLFDEHHQVSIRACVLYNNPQSSEVMLSVLPHILKNSQTLAGDYGSDSDSIPMVGRRCASKIIRILDVGLIVRLLSLKRPALVTRQHCFERNDRKPFDLNESFIIGAKHKCRILGYNAVDELVLVSFRESVLDTELVGRREAVPGKIVNVTVTNVQSDGLVVNIFKNMNAYIHYYHLDDDELSAVNKLSQIKHGDSITCRVLEYNDAKDRRYLTCKPSLLRQSGTELITNYKQVAIGNSYHGYISKLSDQYCIVRFYNNVHAYSRLVPYVRQFLTLGEVVKCRVNSCNIQLEKMTVYIELPDIIKNPATTVSSVAPTQTEPSQQTVEKKPVRDVKVGQLVDVLITNVSTAGFQIHVKGNSRATGFLPKTFISDFTDLNDVILKYFTNGSVIHDALVFKFQTNSRNPIILTWKQSLVGIAKHGNFPTCLSEFEVGQNLTGIVLKVLSYGVLVEFVGNIIGLCPRNFLPIHQQVSHTLPYIQGQTVRAAVVDVDFDEQRLMLSMKTGEVDKPGTEMKPSIERLAEYMSAVNDVNEHIKSASQNEEVVRLLALETGSVVLCVLLAKQRTGVVLKLHVTQGKSIDAVATTAHTAGVDLVIDKQYKAVILKIDTLNNAAEVSLSPELIKFAETAKKGSDLPRPDIGCKDECTVESISTNCVLVSLSALKTFAYLPTHHGWNDLETRSEFIVRKPLPVSVGRVMDGGSILVETVNISDVNNKFFTHFNIEKWAANKNAILSTHEEGDTISGVIRKIVAHKYLVMALEDKSIGLVHVTDISDHFADRPFGQFKTGQKIRAYVLCNDMEYKVLWLSLRQSRICETALDSTHDYDIHTVDQIPKHENVRGYVVDCSCKGIFITLGCNIVGRVPISFAVPGTVDKDWSPKIPVGKLVTVHVLSIPKGTSRILLSMLPKHTGLPGPLSSDRPVTEAPKSTTVEQQSTDLAPDKSSSKPVKEPITTKISPADVKNSVKVGKKKWKDGKDTTLKQDENCELILKVGGFQWENPFDVDVGKSGKHESSSDDENIVEEPPVKKTKLEKSEMKKEREKELYKTELALLDQDRNPESVDDFDRLVLANPNSSIIWLRYMAFHLQAAEIDKARAIVVRALEIISFREETEKWNIWMASLNLENTYGTEETLGDVFRDACKHNEPLSVFKQLANIYINTEKYEDAEQLYNKMVKRFSLNKDVWIWYSTFLMKTKEFDKGQAVLQRALKILEKSNHIDVIVKFAVLEFRYGSSERGRTIFDNILSSYEKRTDVWSVYLDMMIKNNQIDAVRELFEKIIAINLSTRKMKFFFKRYLDFEMLYGNERNVEEVKTKAMHFTESKSS